MTEEAGLASLSTEELQELANKKETHRAKIAAVLKLVPDHPSVTAWFDRLRSLPDLAHYKHGGTNPDEAQRAFGELKQLLFSQLAGYFDTKPELDALLAEEIPDERILARLARTLARPSQRRYFFNRLQAREWLQPLDAAGYLPNAPELPKGIAAGDRLPPWDESSFLASVATVEPDRVAEILLRVRKDNQNPFVWHRLATIALSLPSIAAGRVAEHIAAHFDGGDLGTGQDVHVRLVAHTAEGSPAAAIALARALLRMRQSAQADDREDQIWRRVKWPLKYLRNHELQRLVELSVSSLARVALLDTLRLTLDSLRQAVAIALKEGHSAGSDTFLGRLHDVNDLDDDDARSILAKASAKVILAVTSSEEARAAYALIVKYEGSDVFRRLQLLLFAKHPREFAQEINALLEGDESTHPPFAATEVAAVLRTAFSVASNDARAAFAARVKRGPDLTRIEGDDRRVELKRDWQATRLRWFHEQIPIELHALAESLGVTAVVPSVKQQSLDETGGWVGSISGSVDRTVTPKQVDDLTDMSPTSIAEFLFTYDPRDLPEFQDAGRLAFDGLPETLKAFAKLRPEIAIQVLRELSARPSPLNYVAALIDGLDKHPQQFLDLSSVVAQLLRQTLDWASLQAKREGQHAWLVGHLAEMATAFTDRDEWTGEADTIDKLTSLLNALREYAAQPQSDEVPEGSAAERLRSLVGSGMNRSAGKLVKTAVALARWQSRAVAAGTLDVETAQATLQLALETLRYLLAESDGATARIVQVELGRWLPHLHYVARDWVLEQAPRLLDRGDDAALARPCWAGYLVNNPVYNRIFADLRPWYLLEASSPAGYQDKSDYSLSRNLGLHVASAYLFGFIELKDFDGLLERVFSALTVEDRNHIYADLYRTVRFNEASSERLVQFWEWRLADLESADGASPREPEYEGLSAFIAIVPMRAEATTLLGLRTLTGSRGTTQYESQVWQRITTLAIEEPRGSFPLIDLLARAGMRARHVSFFSFELAAPAIQASLTSDDASTSSGANRLVHDLGESGFEEFGKLLVSQ
ncbi:MAG: hypothetical protein Q8O42_07580 [Acidobacteriota bacterium]|nr:hypothetical protein [Acidobacteriota bacterium]